MVVFDRMGIDHSLESYLAFHAREHDGYGKGIAKQTSDVERFV
jgi:hypothetical protein